MVLLAAKLLLAPACVAAASLAMRRWGARVGGLVGGLPVVAGPILLVLTLMHGPAFGQRAAAASLMGLVALTAFAVVYARSAWRATPAGSLALGWAAFLAVVAVLSLVHVPRGLAAIVVGALLATAPLLVPLPEHAPSDPPAPARWDLPVRMLAAVALVLAVSAASSTLGSHLSGLLAPFPIVTAILAAFTHHERGPAEVQVLVRGYLAGFYGFAAFSLTLALALPGAGTAGAFGLAVLAALATQLAVVTTAGFSRRRAPAPAA